MQLTKTDKSSTINLSHQKIEYEVTETKKILTEVDNEDNSLDIAVIVANNPVVTLNVAVDEENEITIRKQIGLCSVQIIIEKTVLRSVGVL